ncbi:twin-arginine translocase TatA/TatE family subunit [Bartonella sp. DGB1]|uniref:twin-arginine translocase TatA/TatE family subunit n=1 Tax=Bartonella sp. DGB1 TaxID=3239807 RepID=UPI0035265735
MQGLSFSQLLIILLVFLLLFGGRRITSLMTDLAKGIKVFRQTMEEKPAELNDEPDNKK